MPVSHLILVSISEHEGGGGSESSVGDLFAKNMPRRMKTKRSSDQAKNQVFRDSPKVMLKFRKNKQKNQAYVSSTSGEEEEPDVTLDDNELGQSSIFGRLNTVFIQSDFLKLITVHKIMCHFMTLRKKYSFQGTLKRLK